MVTKRMHAGKKSEKLYKKQTNTQLDRREGIGYADCKQATVNVHNFFFFVTAIEG